MRKISSLCLLFYLQIITQCIIGTSSAVFEIPKSTVNIPKEVLDHLNGISTNEWQEFVSFGVDSLKKLGRLETNLLNSNIVVINGSISHYQLLDTLPNKEAQEDDDVATKILKASQYAYNRKCIEFGIKGEICGEYLAKKSLPQGSQLLAECKKIVESRRDGHHPFRRLLPRNYQDGLYQMFSEDKVPLPRLISSKALASNNNNNDNLFENQLSLSIVQWTQFIEHDLSKPVVSSMDDETPIECCNEDNYKLQPRYRHPACAPLLGDGPSYKYGRESCLNYVRSALAVGTTCTFGDIEQLNQATANLDLSQLYGFTNTAQNRIRLFKDGKINSTKAKRAYQDLLPMVSDSTQSFCAFALRNQKRSCFMAGDSRVNSNPFAIVIYTIFMRNHNQIAQKLQTQHPNWDDERLFTIAKSINIEIYKNIVLNEWLPTVLGTTYANDIKQLSINKPISQLTERDSQVSNEFAVAAIRFYFSMMPDVLQKFTNFDNIKKDLLTLTNLLVLKDQTYKPDLNTPDKVNDILNSILHQRAMKIDSWFVESLIVGLSAHDDGGLKHTDNFAFDIQRGRDHGLQGYSKYLEVCNNVKIENWADLKPFINNDGIDKLKSIYKTVFDVDLIVGGISEKAANGSILGPTFTCILGEQFVKIQQLNNMKDDSKQLEKFYSINFSSITAADVLCANSELPSVPRNIFQLVSDRNPLITCGTRLEFVLL